MTYKPYKVFMRTKTNMHVGNGSVNYDIVDKSVQRDSMSDLPIVNASSLKGAIKDHMRNFLKEKSEDTQHLEKKAFEAIFGTDETGLMRFMDTYLLFLPLRANTRAFFSVTSKENLLRAAAFFKENGVKIAEGTTEAIENLQDDTVSFAKESIVEDFVCAPTTIDADKVLSFVPKALRPKHIAILSEEHFIDAVRHLPVIARNKLDEKGKSENLWYEEIVPRESLFYTVMHAYDNFGTRAKFDHKKGFEAFFNILQKESVQIGANASIGFGLCDFLAEEGA